MYPPTASTTWNECQAGETGPFLDTSTQKELHQLALLKIKSEFKLRKIKKSFLDFSHSILAIARYNKKEPFGKCPLSQEGGGEKHLRHPKMTKHLLPSLAERIMLKSTWKFWIVLVLWRKYSATRTRIQNDTAERMRDLELIPKSAYSLRGK